MSKKYYAVYPGQIKIDNEVFFGIDYKITDFINELMEQCKKQQEVIDKIYEFIKELYDNTDDTTCYEIDRNRKEELLDILNEVSE